MTDVRERRATIDGQPMRWLEAGTGWPVVLLHAFPLAADMWRPQLAAVPAAFRFIAPDLRGRSAQAGLAGYAANIDALLDALDIESAAIGGLSMGGYVTFALHRLAPRRFTRLILADTRPHADTAAARAGRDALRRDLAAGGPPAVADAMLPRLLSRRAHREQPDLVRAVRAMIESQDASALDAAILALRDRPDSTADLPGIGVPVLLVAGEQDEVTPPDVAREMERTLPRAHFTMLPEAGHLSSLERPDVFSHALHDFLLAHI